MIIAFNVVSRCVVIEELWDAGGELPSLIPFVYRFYCTAALLFYLDHLSIGSFMTIMSKSDTHQGDPIGGALFAMAHLRAIRALSTTFPGCMFLSIGDDTDIVGLTPLVRGLYTRLSISLHF